MFKNGWKKKLIDFIKTKKKLLVVVAIILVVLSFVNSNIRKSKGTTSGAKTVTVKVEKGFEFPALDNQGKETKNKLQLKVQSVEKTNQVLVRDQAFTAKNNKLFLIVNLDIKNDATSSLNIFPGDLVRMAVENNRENRFAPDLHNNLVPVAAISTKVDRIGFVIPDTARNFVLYIGEVDGDKQEITLNFPS